MQELIAKIIAGEYNVPGSYSMSTLQIIKMLGKDELKLFERVCSLLVNKNQVPRELFLLGDSVKGIMSGLQIDFGSLQTLQSLGLFLPNEMTRTIQNTEKKDFVVTYFGKSLFFTPENENYQKVEMPSCFGLSIVGEQILKHLSPNYIDEYYVWLKTNYKILNYKFKENNP
jgi:hypothetical protein